MADILGDSDTEIQAPVPSLKQDDNTSQKQKGKRNISDERRQQLREQMIALRDKKSQQAQEKKQLEDQLQLQMEEQAKQKAHQKLQKLEKKVERKVKNNVIQEKLKLKPVVVELNENTKPIAKKKTKKTTIVYESLSDEDEEEVIYLKKEKKTKKIPDSKPIKQKPERVMEPEPQPQQPVFQFQFH